MNWRKLALFLIDIKGWTAKGDPSGSTVSTGEFKMSQVDRNYSADGKRLRIHLIDGGFIPVFYAGFNAMLGFEIDTSDEYVRKIKIKGFPAIENYRYKRKEAKVLILVSDRFLIQMEAREMEDTIHLKAIANQLDLKTLSTLSK